MADSIVRLRIDSQEYDAKIKKAGEALNRYFDTVKKGGGTLEYLDEGVLDAVKAMGRMETATATAKGKIAEMTKAFTDLHVQYQNFTDKEKQSPVGKEMAKSLDQLKGRITDAKEQLANANKEIGNTAMNADSFKSIIDGLGQKMGAGVDVTSLLTSKTALLATGIGAATTAVVAATKAWADYNAELSRQDQITTVTTGLKGEDANRMTDQMRALSQTYDVDFREAVNAANTLMTQFGKTGDEAVQLIKDGMQGMVLGDGQKLLSMIQQYAPSFRDAGISASQLVAIIHNSEGGIFTDQNMNAIVMGIKNIRLMTKATSDALAKLGIDGEEMTRKLNDGSMTIFEAMRKVSQAIENTGSGSQAAGEVMQAVFGRQGVAAGTNLGKAIATLNTNLEETKRQTGELGEAYADLQNANERLNKAIRDCFGYDGWEQMTTGIKTQLITALSATLEKCNTLYNALDKLGMVDAFSKISTAVQNLINPFQQLVTLANTLFNTLGQEIKKPVIKGVGYSDMEKSMGYIKRGGSKSVREQRYNAIHADLVEKFNNAPGGAKQSALLRRITMLEQQKTSLINPVTNTPSPKGTTGGGSGKGGTTTPKVEEVYPEGSLKALQKEMRELQDQQSLVTSPEEWQQLQTQIDGVTEKMNTLKGITKEVKVPEEATGFSGLNTEAIGAYQSMLQSAMKSMDFGSEELAQTFANSIDATTLGNLLTATFKEGIDITKMQLADGSTIEDLWDTILDAGNIPDTVWQEIAAKASEEMKKQGKKGGFKVNTQTGDVTSGNDKNSMQQLTAMNTMVNSMNSIASGVQSLGIKIPQGISDTISVLQTIMGIVSAIQAISTVKFFAGGGVVQAARGYIVPGTSYSGDRIPAMLNAGEVVLNRAQAGVIAESLETRENNMGTPQARISGEQIYLTLGAYLKRSGRGEILTSR